MSAGLDVALIESHCMSSIAGRMPTRMEREQLALVAHIRELEATIARVEAAKREVPMPFCQRDGQIVRDLILAINAALDPA